MKIPELLAPAGSEECLYAAVENGADAVYFGIAGLDNFNARVRAKNIAIDKLGETMEYLHRRNVRGYVTLNTLVKPDELGDVEKLLKEISSAHVDAILVQDWGVARLARRLCPDLELHASTQMSLTSFDGIELAKSLGIRRVVLPRELSLEQIKTIRESTDLELEVFVHGALCISFSGQCYASLALGGRSANRGRCAQPCRMPYMLYDGATDKPIQGERQLFSPSDLAALPILPKLVATGVHALKIEGRLKPPEYVAEVTKAYRQALDALPIEPGTSVPDSSAGLERLGLTFSRGFSTGWLEGVNPRKLVPGDVLAHRGTPLGTVVEMRRDAVVVQLSASVRRGDGVLFENEQTPQNSQGGSVYEIFWRQESVQQAEAGARVLLTFANNSIDPDCVIEGQSVRKTADPRLEREIRKSLESHRPRRRVPITIRVRAVVGKPIEINVRSENGAECRLFGEGNLETARKHPISPEVLTEQFSRLGETVYTLQKLDAVIEGGPMVPLSVLGKLRHDMVQSLDGFSLNPAKPITFGPSLAEIRRKDQAGLEPTKTDDSKPIYHILLRDDRLFEDESMLRRCVEAGCRSFYVETKTVGGYRFAATAIRNMGAEYGEEYGVEYVAVLPRIIKPGEERYLSQIAKTEPDAVLVRNLGSLSFFRKRNILTIADFSLNVVNDLSVRQILDWGIDRITPGWDLDAEGYSELLKLVPASRLEQIVAGRMPLFTMEHCLWRANLVEPDAPCENLCRKQPLKIRDRVGAIHSVRSDLLCRNIVENTEAFFAKPIDAIQHRRIEWDDRLGDKTPDETIRKIAVSPETSSK